VYLGDAYICEDTGQVWVCAPNQYNLSTVPSYIYSGLVRLLPDFIVDTSTQQIILNTSTVSINTGTKLTVIKREVGPSWNEVISINSTKSLFDSTGTIAKFLKAGPAIIPNQYFYASSSTVANVSSGYSGGGPVINQPVIGEADSGSSTAVFGPNDPEYDGGTSSSIYNDDLDGGSASL
jgi:hypothetical protein